MMIATRRSLRAIRHSHRKDRSSTSASFATISTETVSQSRTRHVKCISVSIAKRELLWNRLAS